MVLIGLLLVALVCIVLGVVFASGPWFVASLVASVVAAYLLFRQREDIIGRGSTAAEPATPAPARPPSLVTGTAFDTASTGAATDEPEPDDVWVVDGEPSFHTGTCDRLEGTSPERVPRAQAVEDGFTGCATCQPAAPPASTSAASAPAGEAAPVSSRQVWVIDGRPDFHDGGCARLEGSDGEQIPRSQAVEDGFTPCPDCRPDGAAAASRPPEPSAADSSQTSVIPAVTAEPDQHPEPDQQPEPTQQPERSDRPGQVWVVDGRPRYHLAGCLIIEEQDAEAIPLAQATEDGFMPCTLCEPSVTRV